MRLAGRLLSLYQPRDGNESAAHPSSPQVVSLRTKYMALDVIETELLPSDVIKVKFYRPPNFKYLSGQWVRLACTAFRTEEFHSFTLTSAPHENFLSCHIKAQGPWTWKLRNYFDPCNFNPEEDHPKVGAHCHPYTPPPLCSWMSSKSAQYTIPI